MRKTAFLSRALELTSILSLSICSLPHVAAQARYDDHEMRDRIFVSLGGLSTQNMQSQLRIDPKGVGIGTIVDLEDDFDLPKSVSVLRLDGYFRLSKAHRIEWTYFALERDGSATLVDRDVQIGDVVFPIQYRVASDWKFSVIKASYSYSFINTAKYEFYLGGGLNIRNISFGFTGVGSVLGTTDTRVFDDNGKLPLPTLTVGMRGTLLSGNTKRHEQQAAEDATEAERLVNEVAAIDASKFGRQNFEQLAETLAIIRPLQTRITALTDKCRAAIADAEHERDHALEDRRTETAARLGLK